MTLVDTSVFFDHLRRGNDELVSLLERNEVYGHGRDSGRSIAP
jgi:predicted nucleic acid-binding protein